MLGSGEACDGLYILKGSDKELKGYESHGNHSYVVASIEDSENKVLLWHFRLGHPSFLYLERLFPQLFINKSAKKFQCEVCELAKHTRSIYSTIGYQPSKPFAVVHSDIWGPMKIRNVNGARWFITFIDDHTRLTWTFLMKEKSEATSIFQTFYTMVQTQFQTQIQVLKTDNAHDYFNSALGSFLIEHEIIHASSCVNTPQQNGIAERKNRHLLDVARASMFTHHVPKYLWGEAVLTATYLINKMLSRVLGFQTPRQVLLDAFPHISAYTSDLPPKVFDCTVFIHVAPQQRSKLGPQSLKGVFIGYSANQKGYKCYVPHTKRVYNTRDVTFFESQSYFPADVSQGEHIQVPGVQEPQQQLTPDTAEQFVELISLENCINTTDASEGELTSNQNVGKPLQVYHRRSKTIPEDLSNSLEPSTVAETSETSEDSHITELEQLVDDSDVPIAKRKGVRSCTKYPIGRHVSYENLSNSHKGFISAMEGV
ncbi:Retrovirus-related Pol polyprotein from transposon TNT 1-94, partial [Linum perenne]